MLPSHLTLLTPHQSFLTQLLVMAQPCDQTEEDYIDMDISSSSSTFFSYSPPHSRDFEFHIMPTNLLHETEPATSPADELFYKGKLLPLHLPPRLQMVKNLLQTTTDRGHDLHFITATTTPYESCNISPSDSCQVSRELKPEEDYYFIDDHSSKKYYSWSKKIKLIKQSSLGHKLKASRAYLKSLFTKSGCSAESCTDATENMQGCSASKPFKVVTKKNPFGQIYREKAGDDSGVHRRSFSGAILRNLGVKSSSSSSSCSSFSSGSLHGSFESSAQLLRRCSSANSEVEESSIQGAIAHCKKSQAKQVCYARKSVSDVGLCSLSASVIAACDKKRPGMCRG